MKGYETETSLDHLPHEKRDVIENVVMVLISIFELDTVHPVGAGR